MQARSLSRGVLGVGREIELSDYRVLNSPRPIDSSICINGRFADRALQGRAANDLQGRRARISGLLFDCFEYASEDPAAATIGDVQNARGNRFVVTIRSLRSIGAR